MRHTLIIVALATLLAACVQSPPMHKTEGKANLVREDLRTHTFRFAHGDRVISREDRAALARLAAEIEPESTRRILVEGFGAASGRDIHTAGLLKDRTQAVRRALIDAGFPRDAIVIEDKDINPMTHHMSGRNVDLNDWFREVTVTVDFRTVMPPPTCPDWTQRSDRVFDARSSSNLGCATTTNLGAQVADPADMLLGNGDVSKPSIEPVQAIERYYNGEIRTLAGEE